MMKEYATNKDDLSQILSRKYGESLDVTTRDLVYSKCAS